MALATNQLHDGLLRIVANLAAVVRPVSGGDYTINLSHRNAVQVGRVMQLPNRTPPHAPFTLVAFREEFRREGTKNTSRIAEFDVIGWVRGQDAGFPNTTEGRAEAGTLLFDDLERAILADRRMVGQARDVSIRGSGFAGDIIPVWKAYGIAVGRVRVAFNWRPGIAPA